MEIEPRPCAGAFSHLRPLGILIVISVSVAGCTYDDGPDPNWHFFKMQMDAPQGNKVVATHSNARGVDRAVRYFLRI